MPRGGAPENACAGEGARSAAGRPVRPPWARRRCTGHPAEPGGPRSPERSARCAPARGVRVPAGPAVPVWAYVCKTMELRWGRPDDRTAPAQVGQAPVSSPRLADSLAEHEGFEPPLRCLQRPQGIFPRPPQVADRCIVDGGDVAGVRSPERLSRASGLASRRSVLTRSPAFCGSKEGATPPQPSPCFSRER
jgi:hypothetical protein